MDLPSYIRSLHPNDVEAAIARAAERFGVNERAVKGWLYGERKPRPHVARDKIIPASGGKLTFASIYGPPQ